VSWLTTCTLGRRAASRLIFSADISLSDE